jgi:hypothetical protein
MDRIREKSTNCKICWKKLLINCLNICCLTGLPRYPNKGCWVKSSNEGRLFMEQHISGSRYCVQWSWQFLKTKLIYQPFLKTDILFCCTYRSKQHIQLRNKIVNSLTIPSTIFSFLALPDMMISFFTPEGMLPNPRFVFDTQSIVLAPFRWLWGLPDLNSGLLSRQSVFADQRYEMKWNENEMKWKWNEMKWKWNEMKWKWNENEMKMKWNEKFVIANLI